MLAAAAAGPATRLQRPQGRPFVGGSSSSRGGGALRRRQQQQQQQQGRPCPTSLEREGLLAFQGGPHSGTGPGSPVGASLGAGGAASATSEALKGLRAALVSLDFVDGGGGLPPGGGNGAAEQTLDYEDALLEHEDINVEQGPTAAAVGRAVYEVRVGVVGGAGSSNRRGAALGDARRGRLWRRLLLACVGCLPAAIGPLRGAGGRTCSLTPHPPRLPLPPPRPCASTTLARRAACTCAAATSSARTDCSRATCGASTPPSPPPRLRPQSR